MREMFLVLDTDEIQDEDDVHRAFRRIVRQPALKSRDDTAWKG